MAERVCDCCGRKRQVSGGRVCEKGHFVCVCCVSETIGILSGARTQCPLCKRRLR